MDNPAIGILLRKTKNRIIAESVLRNIDTAIGVSKCTFLKLLPEELTDNLPTIDQIEKK